MNRLGGALSGALPCPALLRQALAQAAWRFAELRSEGRAKVRCAAEAQPLGGQRHGQAFVQQQVPPLQQALLAQPDKGRCAEFAAKAFAQGACAHAGLGGHVGQRPGAGQVGLQRCGQAQQAFAARGGARAGERRNALHEDGLRGRFQAQQLQRLARVAVQDVAGQLQAARVGGHLHLAQRLVAGKQAVKPAFQLPRAQVGAQHAHADHAYGAGAGLRAPGQRLAHGQHLHAQRARLAHAVAAVQPQAAARQHGDVKARLHLARRRVRAQRQRRMVGAAHQQVQPLAAVFHKAGERGGGGHGFKKRSEFRGPENGVRARSTRTSCYESNSEISPPFQLSSAPSSAAWLAGAWPSLRGGSGAR